MGLAQTVGAVRTIEIGGKEYGVNELTLGDWTDFEEYVRKQKSHRLIEASKEAGIGATDLLKAINAPLGEDEINGEMSTISGARFLLWKALHGADETMSLEQASALITLGDIPKILPAITGDAIESSESKNVSQPAP